MAGSDQSARLQGMLSQLAGSFSMENMGGAGQAYAQNIRDYNAPVLDANSEDSLLARQRWAQSNGYQDEANQLGVRLGEVGAANQLKAETDDKNARMANMFGNAIPSLPENLQDIARGMRDGIASGEVGYLEAAKWIQNPTSGVNAPAAVREYEFFEGLTEEEKSEYKDLKRGGNVIDLGGGGIGYRRPDGTVQVMVSPKDATALNADFARSSAFSTAEGSQASEDQQAAFDNYTNTSAQIALYDEALDKLTGDGKANTGAVYQLLPTVEARTVELENVRNRLGLGRIAAGKFGQLTEIEMKVAFETEIPVGLPPKELRAWLENRKSAEQKLLALEEDYLRWAQETKGTKAEWRTKQWIASADKDADNKMDPVTNRVPESNYILKTSQNETAEPEREPTADEIVAELGIPRGNR